jgi:hypothetical protein
MATDAVVGSGFILSVTTGTSPVVVTEIGQLKTASRSGTKVKMENITNTTSPRIVPGGVIYEEIIPTTASGGTVAFSGVFGPDDASQTLLQTIQDSGELNVWTITLPPAAGGITPRGHWTFSAYVEDIAQKIEFDKAVEFSGSLALSGPCVYTSGS